MDKKERIHDFDELSPPHHFSPSAFKSINQEEQKVCNYFLALSMMHNDLNDLMWLIRHMRSYDQGEPYTAYNGCISGIQLHLDKLIYSLINELFFIGVSLSFANDTISSNNSLSCFDNLFLLERNNSFL